jgi:hypothetical protein
MCLSLLILLPSKRNFWHHLAGYGRFYEVASCAAVQHRRVVLS